MKDFKGTKGEWYAQISGYKDYIKVLATDDREGYADRTIMSDDDLSGGHCEDCSGIFERRKCDARLIAAAPDLLNALQGLWKDTKENGGLPPEDVEYIDNEFGVTKAINKALGE